MSNFWQRTLTGAAFLAVVIGCILLGQWWFAGLFGLIVIIGIGELNRMMDDKPVLSQKYLSYGIGGVLWLVATVSTLTNVDRRVWLVLVPLVVAVFIYELFRKQERPFWNVAITLFVPVYAVLPFVFLQLLAFVSGEYNAYLVLAFFSMVWVNDTGAYLVGVTIGKRRLFPRISPKKSWEGFIGGIVFTMALSFGAYHVIGLFPVWVWLVAGFIVSVLGTMGDLTESMLKRSMDVKDSGTILPGHGGVLDRFDALTFAAPLVYVLFEIFK